MLFLLTVLRCVSPEMALRNNSLPRSNSVAFGEKRTSDGEHREAGQSIMTHGRRADVAAAD
jgi:hypothetical protein